MAVAKSNRKLALAILGTWLVLFLGIFQFRLFAAPPQETPSTQSTSITASTPSNSPEMTSHDAAVNFKVNVRLVEVHVVVRDAQGKAIGTLQKEDFQLFDDKKPQLIARFSVQKPGLQVAREQQTSQPLNATVTDANAAKMPDLAERYIAYVFDDVHMEFGDLAQARQAAEKNLKTLLPTDRAAIFTISGQNDLDFTDNQTKLRDAMDRIIPRPLVGNRLSECPKMTYYIADLIQNKNDPQALAAVAADVLDCQFDNNPKMQTMAQNVAQTAAAQAVSLGDAETHLTLTTLKDVIRRASGVPGQRCVVLVSPGFLTSQQEYDVDNIIDRAMRANIIINALDARGLYVVMPGGDITEKPSRNSQVAGIEGLYQMASASADEDVMAELADATGGVFFHNNNDLAEGFRRVASTPEYYYVLAFSPQNLKLNGHFHKLKVTLKTPERYSIQARRGYFAPKQLNGPEQEAKQEIEDALFSQEELHDLPIDLHTQFFKPSDSEAKLTVLAHVDVKQLHFRKADGRNNSNLTIVAGIFDRNGNLVVGNEKVLQMRLKDETLAKMEPGLSVKSNFDVKPGSYLVRLVVRDTEGQIAAENGAIQIP
ncbi:MAG TPA: VWA domain-containing protein [Terriglobales bacterium]|nr:VWA domain-containing protein [Terriglobales bacterium]